MDCGAAASLYGAVEGAFGTAGGVGGDDDIGTCAAPSDGSDCAGAVSNCWSPGQRDTGRTKHVYRNNIILPPIPLQIAQAMVSVVLTGVPIPA